MPPILIAAIAALALLAPGAAAQSFPDRPIRLVIPQAAGGTTDTIARAIAEGLGPALGTQVIPDNRPGAGGNIGTEMVAKAPPDGYTLVAGTSGSHTINPHVYEKMPFDTIKDFSPVVLAGYTTNVLLVRGDSPFRTARDLVEFAKANPDKLNYGSAGMGSSPHLAAELFKSVTGTRITHIPYKGSTPSVTALLGGQVDLMFTGLTSAAGHVQAGRLRVLFVSSGKRAPALPNVPTAAEAGFAGFDLSFWIGILAPAGTPGPIVDRLASASIKVLQQPAIHDRLAAQGVEVVAAGPATFLSVLRKDLEKWRDVIQTAGIKPE